MKAYNPAASKLDQYQAKTSEIAAFVSNQVAYLSDQAQATSELLVIAGASQNPVVSAVRAAVSEGGPLGLKLKLILATMPETDFANEMTALAPLEVRVTSSQDLRHAHEQLVIGDGATWIGDCMRRDPTKRDALQSFNTSCEDTIRWARISFDRIWDVSQPILEIESHTPRRTLSGRAAMIVQSSVNRIQSGNLRSTIR